MINYKLIGTGEKTVLFLHGWGGNANSFLFCFSSVPSEYKVLTIDFTGFGESEKLAYCFSVFDYACEVFAVLNKLNIFEVSIVAHSFGGRVAILLEAMFNLKVNAMLLADIAGIKPRFSLIKHAKIIKFKFLKLMHKHKLINLNINKYGSSDYKKLNMLEKQSFKKIVNFDERKYLPFLHSKVALFWGDKDTSTPLYMAKILHKKIAHSTLTVIKNGEHFCYLTHQNIFKFVLNSLLNS